MCHASHVTPLTGEHWENCGNPNPNPPLMPMPKCRSRRWAIVLDWAWRLGKLEFVAKICGKVFLQKPIYLFPIIHKTKHFPHISISAQLRLPRVERDKQCNGRNEAKQTIFPKEISFGPLSFRLNPIGFQQKKNRVWNESLVSVGSGSCCCRATTTGGGERKAPWRQDTTRCTSGNPKGHDKREANDRAGHCVEQDNSTASALVSVDHNLFLHCLQRCPPGKKLWHWIS